MVCMVIYLFNELDILDINLHDMGDIVDKYIIVEYPFGYDRSPRESLYLANKERFKEFEHKIIHVMDNCTYDGAEYNGGTTGIGLMWNRKNSPLIVETLSFCDDNDFIIICDGDVAMNRKVFDDLDMTMPTTFVSHWCMYWFDYRSTTQGYAWTSGVPYRDLKMRGSVGNIIGWQPEIQQTIQNAGWHFAKTGGVDAVISNIKSYPHQEFAGDSRLLDPVLVQARIDNGWGWNDYTDGQSEGAKAEQANMVWDKFDPDFYPKYVIEHPEIYAKHFKNRMK